MGRNSSGAGGARGGTAVARPGTLGTEFTDVGGGVSIRSYGPPVPGGEGTQHDIVEIKIDGQHAGRMSYQIDQAGRVEINDTVLSDRFRGRGTVAKFWPRFERHVRAIGGKRIIARVVDQAVGTRVWAKVGFKPITNWNGKSQTWEKKL
ncbi:MAG: hypothetical protein AB7O62_00260 [Pirellulales bacterium]